MKYGDLIKKLKSFEVGEEVQTPWPPQEGDLEYSIWLEMGKPKDRISLIKMLEYKTEKIWNEEGEGTEKTIE